jgi:hypothetical protein
LDRLQVEAHEEKAPDAKGRNGAGRETGPCDPGEEFPLVGGNVKGVMRLALGRRP